MRDAKEHHNIAEHEDVTLEDLKTKSAKGWRDVLAQYGPGLLGYAKRMLGDRATAEDVVQEALLSVYKTIDNFDARSGTDLSMKYAGPADLLMSEKKGWKIILKRVMAIGATIALSGMGMRQENLTIKN